MDFRTKVTARALEVFGSRERAEIWLEKMSEVLGTSPELLLETQVGYERVLRHLHSVDIALNLD